MDVHTQVGEIIQAAQRTLPDKDNIDRIDYEVGVDWEGDAAVQIWVILPAEAIATHWNFENCI